MSDTSDDRWEHLSNTSSTSSTTTTDATPMANNPMVDNPTVDDEQSILPSTLSATNPGGARLAKKSSNDKPSPLPPQQPPPLPPAISVTDQASCRQPEHKPFAKHEDGMAAATANTTIRQGGDKMSKEDTTEKEESASAAASAAAAAAAPSSNADAASAAALASLMGLISTVAAIVTVLGRGVLAVGSQLAQTWVDALNEVARRHPALAVRVASTVAAAQCGVAAAQASAWHGLEECRRFYRAQGSWTRSVVAAVCVLSLLLAVSRSSTAHGHGHGHGHGYGHGHGHGRERGSSARISNIVLDIQEQLRAQQHEIQQQANCGGRRHNNYNHYEHHNHHNHHKRHNHQNHHDHHNHRQSRLAKALGLYFI